MRRALTSPRPRRRRRTTGATPAMAPQWTRRPSSRRMTARAPSRSAHDGATGRAGTACRILEPTRRRKRRPSKTQPRPPRRRLTRRCLTCAVLSAAREPLRATGSGRRAPLRSTTGRAHSSVCCSASSVTAPYRAGADLRARLWGIGLWGIGLWARPAAGRTRRFAVRSPTGVVWRQLARSRWRLPTMQAPASTRAMTRMMHLPRTHRPLTNLRRPLTNLRRFRRPCQESGRRHLAQLPTETKVMLTRRRPPQ